MDKTIYSIYVENAIGEKIEIKVAPLILRVQAYLVDLLFLVFLQVFVLGIFFSGILAHLKDFISGGYLSSISMALFVIINFSILILYFLLQEYFWNGKTIGKHFFNLRVISSTGGAVSLVSCIWRNLLRVLEVGYFPLIAGFIAFFSPKNHRLGDMIGLTHVIFEESYEP